MTKIDDLELGSAEYLRALAETLKEGVTLGATDSDLCARAVQHFADWLEANRLIAAC